MNFATASPSPSVGAYGQAPQTSEQRAPEAPLQSLREQAEEELHPYDALHPCCVKEGKMRTKALQMYEALSEVDVTKIAMERRRVVANLPRAGHVHTKECDAGCTHDIDDYDAEEDMVKKSALLYSERADDEEDDDTDSDLDAMLDGFDEGPSTVFEENLEHLKDQRLARLKHSIAADDLERRKFIEMQQAATELRVVNETDVQKVLQKAQRAVVLVVSDQQPFFERSERDLEALEPKDFISKIVNDRMTAMARVVHGSLFYRLEAPSSSFLSSFRIASLPCIVCIDCCNIVAKTSSMDELTSDGSLGIRDIIQKFDDWVEVAGMLKPTSRLAASSSARASDSEEDEGEEVYECGMAGCGKKFFHEHIGVEGRDAATLGGM